MSCLIPIISRVQRLMNIFNYAKMCVFVLQRMRKRRIIDDELMGVRRRKTRRIMGNGLLEAYLDTLFCAQVTELICSYEYPRLLLYRQHDVDIREEGIHLAPRSKSDLCECLRFNAFTIMNSCLPEDFRKDYPLKRGWALVTIDLFSDLTFCFTLDSPFSRDEILKYGSGMISRGGEVGWMIRIIDYRSSIQEEFDIFELEERQDFLSIPMDKPPCTICDKTETSTKFCQCECKCQLCQPTKIN